MDTDGLLNFSCKMFRIVTVVMVMVVFAVAADVYLRSSHQDQAAAAIVAQLGISWTALTPAGTASRRPEARHRGVDLRFSPQLPLQMNPADPFFYFSQAVSPESTQ